MKFHHHFRFLYGPLFDAKNKTGKWIGRTFYSRQVNIVKRPMDVFDSVYMIKDDTWEDNYLPEVFNINKGYFGKYLFRRQDILKVPNATVTDKSDIVETLEGVLWDKAYQENFAITIPTDNNLFCFSSENVLIQKYKRSERINGCVVSLLGVHSHIWSHSLIQFLPKLFYAAEAGLLDNELTLLVPNYSDKQLEQIVSDFIKYYKNVKLKYAESRVEYICETLYWIPSASYLANNANIIHPSLIVIPEQVFRSLKINLGNRNTKDLVLDPKRNEKIYLIRRNGLRLLSNIDEVEDYFKSEGFDFVDPGKLTLEEKVRVFYHARIIVGPLSSAFTNVVFSRPGVKVLELTNMIRTLDTYATLFPAFDVISLYVTGDDNSGNVHSDYTLSLDKIKNAYQYLLSL